MKITLKQYQRIKLAIVFVLAFSISQSIVFKNFFVPVILIAVSSILLVYLRRQVKGIVADERDYQIAGKSALLAMQVFSWVAVVFMFVFYALSETNYVFEPVAMALAFSVCALMLLYSFIFKYYIRKNEK